MKNPLTYFSLFVVGVGILGFVYLPSRQIILGVLLLFSIGSLIGSGRDRRPLFARLLVGLLMASTIVAAFYYKFAADLVFSTVTLFGGAILALSLFQNVSTRQKLFAAYITFAGGLVAATIFNYNAIAQFAAQNHSTTIEGQVFIVTKNGDSLKLGDIQVSIMEKPSFDKALVEAAQDYRTILELAEAKIKEGLTIEKAASADSKSASPNLAANDRDMAKTANDEIEDGYKSQKDALAAIFDGVEVAGKRLTSTKTDADGKFRIATDMAKGNFYVFAKAKRRIRGQEKVLIWAIDSWSIPNPLLLSNHNLYTIDDLERIAAPQ